MRDRFGVRAAGACATACCARPASRRATCRGCSFLPTLAIAARALLRRARRDRRRTSRSASSRSSTACSCSSSGRSRRSAGSSTSASARSPRPAALRLAGRRAARCPSRQHPAQLPDGRSRRALRGRLLRLRGRARRAAATSTSSSPPGEIVAVCGEHGLGQVEPAQPPLALLRPAAAAASRSAGSTLPALRSSTCARPSRSARSGRCCSRLPLRDNLLAARPDATEDDVLAACEAAGVGGVPRRAAGRLRHADRRARRQPLGRAAPARRARARADLERARARARRPALGRRHRDRGSSSCAARGRRWRAAPCCSPPAALDRRGWPTAWSCSRTA